MEPAGPGASLTALADVHAEEWQLGAVGADAVEVLTVELSLPLLLPQLHPADVTAAVEEVLLQPPVGEKRGKGTPEPREAPLPPRALKPKAPHLLLRLMREAFGSVSKEVLSTKELIFPTVVLEKTLESPLDSKEIKPVNPKGNQS